MATTKGSKKLLIDYHIKKIHDARLKNDAAKVEKNIKALTKAGWRRKAIAKYYNEIYMEK